MKLLKIILCLALLIESTVSLGLPRKLQNRFDSVKKKMNKLLKGKKGNELFLDISELEYPKANESLRQVYREQWREYYECLKNRLDDAGPERTTYPIVLLALEGTSVTLKCKLCVSPAELHSSESIEWLYNSTMNSSIANIPIDTMEHIIVTPDERDLNLFNVQLDEAGIYWCHLEDTASPPYYLHVANDQTEPTRPVRPETSKDSKNYPTPPENLEQYGLRVFSAWSTWSPCSTCDKVGQRTRYGYCTISLIENSANSAHLPETGQSKNEESEKTDGIKTEESSTVRRRRRDLLNEEMTSDSPETTGDETEGTNEIGDKPTKKKPKKSPAELRALAHRVLPIFRNKLPCRSPQTPKDIMKIGEIGDRQTEIMTGFCKTKCQKEIIFEIRDKSGKVLESANNSAGIYSMVQGMPEPRPSAERITIYRKHEKKVELKCPGNLNSDVPIIWQIGTKVLVPSIIKKETDARISVDPQQQILIKKVRYADANIYSCWQRGELAGTIRLEVTDEVELKVDHRVFMIGAIVIVSVMLLVFWRAYRGRKRFTMH